MGRPMRLLVGLCLLAVLVQLSHQKKMSKVVDFVPEGEVVNEVDDVSASDNCVSEIKNYCSDLTFGEGAVADCLSDHIAESETENPDSVVSDACREEVYQFNIRRNSNINSNLPLAQACKVDANKYCNVTWFFGYKAGQVIACLRDVKDRVAPGCKKQIFKLQLQAADDMRVDALLFDACKDDAGLLCKDVKFGGGRVQSCLRDQRMKLSWTCEEQLFRQEIENADDVRLSVRLFLKCLPDKKKFCEEVAPGSARVKDCLEAHRNDAGFSAECKAEVDAMIEARVKDFRLDSRLRNVCEDDIYNMCALFGDTDTVDSDDSSVIRCLQDFLHEIRSDACKAQVYKYQELAASDIRFDVPLAEACFEDRQKLCGNIPPGSARVIRCMTTKRLQLSPNCRAVLFDEEVRFSENIDFQVPMKAACEKELELFCKDIPHGQARAIRCLQENQKSRDFSDQCRNEVAVYEQDASSDYRLNHRLSLACSSDIQALCQSACKTEEGQICGGTVLRCLTDNKDSIKSESCQKEVFYFEKMEVSDFRNDVILATACSGDVDKYCKKTGDGSVHDCLRHHRNDISETCRKEELLLEELEAENVELRSGILKACSDERPMFCKGVQAGQARVFRCLAEKMGDADFGETCRGEITNKLLRRQANWRLDPPLRKACRVSVRELCATEDSKNGEQGAVYKCLIGQYDDLDAGCQKELGRAMHMAFFVWQPAAILTSGCDADISRLCLAERPNMAKTPGAVGTCLAALVEANSHTTSTRKSSTDDADSSSAASLSPECRLLADVAVPPNMKKAFDASLSFALLQSQLSALESTTGLPMLARDGRTGEAQGVTLTGWTALAGVAALVVCIMGGATYALAHYRGTADARGDYTLVVKGAPAPVARSQGANKSGQANNRPRA